MSFLVMKFGGTSVADVDHIKTAAEKNHPRARQWS